MLIDCLVIFNKLHNYEYNNIKKNKNNKKLLNLKIKLYNNFYVK